MSDQAVFLDDKNMLFAMESAPSVGAVSRNTGVVILNSGTINNVGPFGLSIDFARSLSREGFPVLRLDQTGKGESSDMPRESSEEDTLKRDIEFAYGALNRQFSVDKIVIIGLCSGADHGIEASSMLVQVAGLVMLDGWAPRDIRYYIARYAPKLRQPLLLPGMLLRRFFPSREPVTPDDILRREIGEERGARWDQDKVLSQIRELCDRKVPILAVYTGDADDYYSYAGQLGIGLQRSSIDTSLITESYKPNRKHLYPIAAHRDCLVKDVTEWVLSIS